MRRIIAPIRWSPRNRSRRARRSAWGCATADPPATSRPLSAGEIALARSVFGDAIDPAPVRIHRRKWWPLQPADVCMAPDGHLWIAPGSALWRDDYAAAPIGLQGFFIHELTHVWQAQRGGRYFLPLIRHPFCRYRYRLRPGKPFRRYGIEQQAEIVRRAFLDPTGAAPERSLLPFGPGAVTGPR